MFSVYQEDVYKDRDELQGFGFLKENLRKLLQLSQRDAYKERPLAASYIKALAIEIGRKDICRK